MKPFRPFIVVLLVLSGAAAWSQQTAAPTAPPKPAASEGDVAVYFSPEGGAADALVYLIRGARKSVSVEMFMFTNDKIADALIAAHKRGVAVDVVFHEEHIDVPGSVRDKLRRAGIVIYKTPEDLTMHNKVLIVDEAYLATGSFNYTVSADKYNVENLVVIRDRPKIIKAFLDNHAHLQSISKKYGGDD